MRIISFRPFFTTVFWFSPLLLGGLAISTSCDAQVGKQGYVNVKDFSSLVVDGGWSQAIQAAFDDVSASNGYANGSTIYFPPGKYRLDKTIVLGRDPAHFGIRLSGYGAVLVGTAVLDRQPSAYQERLMAAENSQDSTQVAALPVELDYDGENVGAAMLELWDPEGQEGVAYVIEGLTFTRESKKAVGVGIKIPAETIPKNVTFRDIKIYGQNVGVHINFSFQVRFESCILRSNRIGIWGLITSTV